MYVKIVKFKNEDAWYKNAIGECFNVDYIESNHKTYLIVEDFGDYYKNYIHTDDVENITFDEYKENRIQKIYDIYNKIKVELVNNVLHIDWYDIQTYVEEIKYIKQNINTSE